MDAKELRLKKVKVELSRVKHGRLELEYKILERYEDIARLEEALKLQDEVVLEKENIIKDLEKEL